MPGLHQQNTARYKASCFDDRMSAQRVGYAPLCYDGKPFIMLLISRMSMEVCKFDKLLWNDVDHHDTVTKPKFMRSKNGIHLMSFTDSKSVFSYLHLSELSFLSRRE